MTNRTAFPTLPGILSLVTPSWTFHVGRYKHTTGGTNIGKIYKEPNVFAKQGFQGMYNKLPVETLVGFEILTCS